MIVFRVTESINIKTTDGTLVKYDKLKDQTNLFNENIYVSTYEDYEDFRKVLYTIGLNYKAKPVYEKKIRELSQFPKELGISNLNEYRIIQKLDFQYKSLHFKLNEDEFKSLYLDETFVDIEEQLKGTLKQDISVVILGSPGHSISQMICASTALRILYEKLNKKFKSVKLDIYLNASENKYYSRDKMIFTNQPFVNKVSALSLNIKEFCSYDFFIDLSSVTKRSYYKSLAPIDAWLYKFGIDYKKIKRSEKYNSIDISSYKPNKELEQKINKIKAKGKVLLYHPYSANINKSMPKEIAIKLLKELIIKLSDYTIVSVLKLDSKLDDDRYVDLSAYSKSFLDYAYIVSNMTKIVATNTSVYHLSDVFFIPTILISTNYSIQDYPNLKIVYVKDKSKNFSNFIFKNEALILHKFEGWNKLRASQIIKLLESF